MCIFNFIVFVCFIDCYGIIFFCFFEGFFEFGLVLYVYLCDYVDLYYDLFVLFVYLYFNDSCVFYCL